MVAATKELWSESYPTEPFFAVVAEEKNDGGDLSQHDSLLLDGFDLLGSTDRQAGFLWQVSSPLFREERFLEEAVESNSDRLMKEAGFDPSK